MSEARKKAYEGIMRKEAGAAISDEERKRMAKKMPKMNYKKAGGY